MKRVVVSLHGIESDGAWQNKLAPVLCHYGMTPYPLNYGRFTKWQLLQPWQRSAKIDWLNRELQSIRTAERVDRLSVIAHSFGSYLLAGALKKYPQVRVDNVVLCGSIVDPKFDWARVFGRHQVTAVRNEVGGKDVWSGATKYLHIVIRDAGPAGRSGFENCPSAVSNERLLDLYGHSDFFQAGHAEQSWLPFLHELHTCDEERQAVATLLDVGLQLLSSRRGIPSDNLRANVMLPTFDAKALYIPEGLAFPAARFYRGGPEPEVTIRIPIGAGAAGLAFKNGDFVFAIGNPGWTTHPIPHQELAKAHPDLKWIVSVPIPDLDDRFVFGISGVLNIDCLGVSQTIGQLDNPALKQDLQSLARDIAEFLKNRC